MIDYHRMRRCFGSSCLYGGSTSPDLGLRRLAQVRSRDKRLMCGLAPHRRAGPGRSRPIHRPSLPEFPWPAELLAPSQAAIGGHQRGGSAT
eukprot:58226-Prymnesium_polylepis.1